MDPDDEVRDRATYYLHILQTEKPELYKHYIIERETCSLALLEKALLEHLNGECNTAFDLSIVPKATIVKEEIKDEAMLVSSAPRAPKITREEESAARLAQLPGIQALGPIHRTTPAIQLTESETEYTVSCIKHIFPNHVVFQFDCLNTLSDQILENVRVELTIPDGFITRAVIYLVQNLPYNDLQTTFVIVEFPQDVGSSAATFGATLRFVVKDCDPNTGEPDSEEGYDDEYMLEDLEITVADQIQKNKKSNFQAVWDAADTEEWVEAEDTYSLSAVNTLQEAVNTIIKFLGLAPANLSEKVPEGLQATPLGGAEILVRSKLALADGVTMQLTVRTTEPDVAELVTAAIG
ncbi:hypothetical protein DOY81_011375 [Sarcophaga bullata]|nr:hypothetical protein DOY81_011375 [Sarcophaga bullata]